MALATISAPLASLDDVAAHPLCTLIRSGQVVDSCYRYDLCSALFDTNACDDELIPLIQEFIADGIPFTLTIHDPVDQDAFDAEAAQEDRDYRDLWAAHGPGR